MQECVYYNLTDYVSILRFREMDYRFIIWYGIQVSVPLQTKYQDVSSVFWIFFSQVANQKSVCGFSSQITVCIFFFLVYANTQSHYEKKTQVIRF